MKHGESADKRGLTGILGGLGSLVESLGEMLEKVQAEGGELRREGHGPLGKGPGRANAVYGFSMRVGLPGEKTRVEPFGNVRRDRAGEPVVAEHREPLVDLLEESEHLLVLVELPGVREKDIHLELNGDVLVLRADGNRNKFYKEVLLPCTPVGFASSYRNGILEVRLARPKATGNRADSKAGGAHGEKRGGKGAAKRSPRKADR